MAQDGAMTRYWSALGLKPGVSLEQLDTTYYTIVQRYSDNPDEDETKRRGEQQHAYNILRRYLVARAEEATGRGRWLSMLWTYVPALVLVVGTIVLVALSMKDLKIKFVEHDTGTVLRLKGKPAHYGTVMGFERRHAFATGNPGPAYQIRLADSGTIVWVGERVVEKGMEPAPSE